MNSLIENPTSCEIHAVIWFLNAQNLTAAELLRQLFGVYGLSVMSSGFGGLEVACWPLVPKFAGSHLAKAVGFLGRKNPQHAFLKRGSKAVNPML